MKPEAKAKVEKRHKESIAIYNAWLAQFKASEQPGREARIRKFDECVDFMTPDAIRKSGRNKKRAKVEHSSRT